MADEQAPSPSVESAAPAAPADPQVSIQLGPNLDLYPTELRPSETPEPSPARAPEAAETEPPESPEPAAGSADQPQGSRRRANEDAYQRGLSEGRAAYEREQSQKAQADQAQRVQREATQRVEQLFTEAESQDYATRDRAWRAILDMYRGNRQAQALVQSTRQQLLNEMAADFGKLGEIEGVTEEGYQQLHSAPSAADLARRAFDLGKKSRDDQVTRLEAEVQGLRGRLVGSKATPEKANGAGADTGSLSIEQYLALSPKDAAKLSSKQIDAMTAQFFADQQRNGR
jgi:hypothetical protein